MKFEWNGTCKLIEYSFYKLSLKERVKGKRFDCAKPLGWVGVFAFHMFLIIPSGF